MLPHLPHTVLVEVRNVLNLTTSRAINWWYSKATQEERELFIAWAKAQP